MDVLYHALGRSPATRGLTCSNIETHDNNTVYNFRNGKGGFSVQYGIRCAAHLCLERTRTNARRMNFQSSEKYVIKKKQVHVLFSLFFSPWKFIFHCLYQQRYQVEWIFSRYSAIKSVFQKKHISGVRSFPGKCFFCSFISFNVYVCSCFLLAEVSKFRMQMRVSPLKSIQYAHKWTTLGNLENTSILHFFLSCISVQFYIEINMENC